VRVSSIDINALRRNRDQLFAEAVIEFRADQPWWPDGAFERSVIKLEQEARYETDAWSQPISDYLEGRTRVRVNDVAHDALGLPVVSIGTSQQRRIAGVLTTLGWSTKRDKHGRWYVRPGDALVTDDAR
jgi:predicted P-loop ATPase